VLPGKASSPPPEGAFLPHLSTPDEQLDEAELFASSKRLVWRTNLRERDVECPLSEVRDTSLRSFHELRKVMGTSGIRFVAA
jgi:hypothetical protein